MKSIIPWIENPEFRSLFDLWMGYHEKDDIIYSYCKHCYKDDLNHSLTVIPQKNKMCMFVSSCFNRSHRKEYLYELMKHSEIDSYGKLFNNKRLPDDRGEQTLLEVIKEYKFVIAFENAIAKDYVTEKYYNPLLAGTVPVYLGAPNILDFAPGENCFVDTKSFDTPKRLADFLNQCYSDNELYQRFFKWREKPLLQSYINRANREKVNPIIRLCIKLQQMSTV